MDLRTRRDSVYLLSLSILQLDSSLQSLLLITFYLHLRKPIYIRCTLASELHRIVTNTILYINQKMGITPYQGRTEAVLRSSLRNTTNNKGNSNSRKNNKSIYQL